MQIPIVSGVYADTRPEFRTSYPINLRPVPKATGLSEGYLKPIDGITQTGTGPGVTRGGIEWNGTCYRVMGSKLVSVATDGTVTTLGDVEGTTATVSMAYSFDRLAIASNEKLFYWDGSTLTEVTDPDLGVVLDVIWTDGYFLTTDGEFIVSTELSDPTAVDPFKYGSSEFEPDPVVALQRVRNEVYAINRYTIEIFQNTGGVAFPFTVVRGAQIERGAVGTHAVCRFGEGVAFVGSGKKEKPSVYIGANGTSAKIGTREIDQKLAEFTEAQLAQIVIEAISEDGHDVLMIHLSDRTLCFDAGATAAMGQPVWYEMMSSYTYSGQYLARHFVWSGCCWMVGDPTTAKVGELDPTVMTHWGEKIAWRFATPIIYNSGAGGIIHEIEAVGMGGAVATGVSATIETQYSTDGVTWSQAKRISVDQSRNRRMRWMRQGPIKHWRAQRFSGTSDSPISFARLEARIEGLAW
ncbi:MAG: hypothetical protein EP341_00855 [Sphingomonadales bacterium]|nr:MAG: hypothetical protein EP341_00855 [Sphingomonadales bacterium]